MDKKLLFRRNVWLRILYFDIRLFIELGKLFLQQTFWPSGYAGRLGGCRWSPTLSSTLSFAALSHAGIRRYPLYLRVSLRIRWTLVLFLTLFRCTLARCLSVTLIRTGHSLRSPALVHSLHTLYAFSSMYL